VVVAALLASIGRLQVRQWLCSWSWEYARAEWSLLAARAHDHCDHNHSLLTSAPFPVQDSFKEPKELGECLLTACHEEKCRGGRFADAKRCCGIGKEGAAMVRDLLAANDVAWTLIDSGVVDEEWDLFKLFKEHCI
jgi:hypothetical protein